MSVRAGKYNTKLHKYEDVLLPDECRTYEEDMEKMVPCAQWADYTNMVRCTHREKYILHMDLDLRSVENATMMKWTDF